MTSMLICYILFLLSNGGRSKARSKWLIRMDFKMDLPLPIFQPISETFQKDRLTPKISFSVIIRHKDV